MYALCVKKKKTTHQCLTKQNDLEFRYDDVVVVLEGRLLDVGQGVEGVPGEGGGLLGLLPGRAPITRRRPSLTKDNTCLKF